MAIRARFVRPRPFLDRLIERHHAIARNDFIGRGGQIVRFGQLVASGFGAIFDRRIGLDGQPLVARFTLFGKNHTERAFAVEMMIILGPLARAVVVTNRLEEAVTPRVLVGQDICPAVGGITPVVAIDGLGIRIPSSELFGRIACRNRNRMRPDHHIGRLRAQDLLEQLRADARFGHGRCTAGGFGRCIGVAVTRRRSVSVLSGILAAGGGRIAPAGCMRAIGFRRDGTSIAGTGATGITTAGPAAPCQRQRKQGRADQGPGGGRG